MAYLTGATGSSPHIDDLISTLQTFLTANGWTTWDDVSATDKIFRAVGQGKERIFVRFQKVTGQLEISTFQYWDNVGHTGFNRGGNPGDTPPVTDDVSAFNFFVFTDGRAVALVTKVGATYELSYSGGIDRTHDANIAISQGAVAAGVDVVVPVDESFSAQWEIGRRVMVLDQSTVTIGANEIGNEHALVKSVAVGSITLDLIQAHQAGALIGIDPQPVVINEIAGNVFDEGAGLWSTNAILLWQTNSPNGPIYAMNFPLDDIDQFADPDARTGRLLHQPIMVFRSIGGSEEVRGKLAGILAAPLIGIGAEDTTDLAGGTYISLPVSTGGRGILMPTF